MGLIAPTTRYLLVCQDPRGPRDSGRRPWIIYARNGKCCRIFLIDENKSLRTHNPLLPTDRFSDLNKTTITQMRGEGILGLNQATLLRSRHLEETQLNAGIASDCPWSLIQLWRQTPLGPKKAGEVPGILTMSTCVCPSASV